MLHGEREQGTIRSMFKRHPFVSAIALSVAVWTSVISLTRIDSKPCSHDEAYTRLWSSGNGRRQAVDAILSDPGTTVARLLELQEPRPVSSKEAMFEQLSAVASTVRNEDQIHPPLYYWGIWAVERVFHKGLLADRATSAAWRALNPWLIGWLALELYGSPLAAMMAIALMYVSPLQMRVGITARDYPAFVGLATAASALLLVCMRKRRWRNWLAYSAILTIGLNLSFLTGLLLLGHAAFIIDRVRNERDQSPLLPPFLAALVPPIATACFYLFQLPFLRTQHFPFTLAENKNIPYLLLSSGKNLVQIFLDLDDVNRLLTWQCIGFVLATLAVILVSLRSAVTGASRSERLPFWVAACAFFPFFTADVLSSSTYFATDRHVILAHTMVLLMVARQLQIWCEKRRNGWLAFASLVAMGLLSCEIVTRTDTWQPRTISHFNRLVANVLRPKSGTTLIGDVTEVGLGNLLALSNDLSPDTIIVGNLGAHTLLGTPAYTLAPSALQKELIIAKGAKLVEIDESGVFFRVVAKESIQTQKK
jgi:uncharacterized membrane protein